MAKKHSNPKAAHIARRKKQESDYFNKWTDPRDACQARRNFLAYCALLDRVAVVVSRFVTELHRVGREIPSLQSIALPVIIHDSVFLDLDNAGPGARGRPFTEGLEALREPAERLLKLLPEMIAAANELDQRIFDFVEQLTGGPGSDEEVSQFVLRTTGLGTLESRKSASIEERFQLELNTFPTTPALPALASATEQPPARKGAA